MSAGRPPRILIVDDEPQIRILLARALNHAGYDVVAMNDGQAGLDAVTTAEEPFDLVVSNNCMPHLNGYQLIAAIQQRYPTLPILHLDDGSIPGHQPISVESLLKPFGIERLLDAVRHQLGRQDRLR